MNPIESASADLIKRCADPIALEGVRWLCAVRSAQELKDLTAQEFASFLYEGFPGTNSWSAEECADELFATLDGCEAEALEEEIGEINALIEKYVAEAIETTLAGL